MDTSAGTRRAFWLKTLHQWHWISAALSLAGMMLFALTGLLLNNASLLDAEPEVHNRQLALPEHLRTQLANRTETATQAPLPLPVRHWLEAELAIHIGERPAEFSREEIYLSLPRPGSDTWLSIDVNSGEIEYEYNDHGWVAYFNDLHKGRHTSRAWRWFIDVFALACLVFTVSGLALLALHARQRPSTWSLTTLGLLAPLILLLLFIH